LDSYSTTTDQIALKELGKKFRATRLSGGDINEVFKLSSGDEEYIIKINDNRKYPGMFDAEKQGLQRLRSVECFKIPQVITAGALGDTAYLILEYIEAGSIGKSFWRDFGRNLAQMHQNTALKFGLDHNNYIGSLAQYNQYTDRAASFYIEQRLEPQFELARNSGYQFGSLSNFYKHLEDLIPEQPPSLVHGDLWSGNYMVGPGNEPVLIDPAVSYAPREMDLAMMELFGGFKADVFSSYAEHYPLEAGYRERLPLWQLYYLLVHLNLFGSGYLGRVKSVIGLYC
jgi:fructosamine-3-kinase